MRPQDAYAERRVMMYFFVGLALTHLSLFVQDFDERDIEDKNIRQSFI